MKLWHSSPALLVIYYHLLPTFTVALECGGPLTKPCLGETDIRYDPDASNSLFDQAAVWKKQNGYFSCLQYGYDPVTKLPYEGGVNPIGLPANSFPNLMFMNRTIVGSRSHMHQIRVYENINNQVNAPKLPGFVIRSEAWMTSTYEKDGTGLLVSLQANTTNAAEFGPEKVQTLQVPVNDRTLYYSGTDTNLLGEIFVSGYTVCLDDGPCDQLALTQDIFLQTENGSERLAQTVIECDRLESAEAWVEAVEAAYETSNVLPGLRVPVPMEEECFSGACPTQDDWCMTDPNCSESPYQEPEGSIKSGALAGFVVLGIFVLIVNMAMFHYVRMKQQESRYKQKFAKRIADTITVRQSIRSLTPDVLAKQFQQIDSEVTQDGRITKDELWKFLDTGAAGEMSQSDFNALFNAIDLDGNGTVDFLEFCTFMGKCSEEYRHALGNRKSLAKDVSVRLSLASKAAKRVSQRVSSTGGGQAAEDAKKVAELMAGNTSSQFIGTGEGGGGDGKAKVEAEDA